MIPDEHPLYLNWNQIKNPQTSPDIIFYTSMCKNMIISQQRHHKHPSSKTSLKLNHVLDMLFWGLGIANKSSIAVSMVPENRWQ